MNPSESADRAIRYAGQIAGIGAQGILDTTLGPTDKPRSERFMDWLECTDAGYGLGLLSGLSAAFALVFGPAWIAALLLGAAFTLCWLFA